MIRCPLVLDRLEWDAEKGKVVYHARPQRKANPYGDVARCDVLDFIARLTQHIPDTSQQLLRYWGFYSNAARGRRRRDPGCSGDLPDPALCDTHGPATGRACGRSISWARLLRKVYELDPLLCGYCGAQMKIVAGPPRPSSPSSLPFAGSWPESTPSPLAHSPPDFELVPQTV